MKNKTVFIDMDDTIADFGNAKVFDNSHIDDSKMYEPGFFRDLAPIDGALVAVRKLTKLGFEVHILTQPVAHSPHSYSEKVQWIGKWFSELLQTINMVQDKGLIVGDYLIDDNLKKWKAKFETNGGKFVHFPYVRGEAGRISNRENWEKIVKYFETVAANEPNKSKSN